MRCPGEGLPEARDVLEVDGVVVEVDIRIDDRLRDGAGGVEEVVALRHEEDVDEDVAGDLPLVVAMTREVGDAAGAPRRDRSDVDARRGRGDGFREGRVLGGEVDGGGGVAKGPEEAANDEDELRCGDGPAAVLLVGAPSVHREGRSRRVPTKLVPGVLGVAADRGQGTMDPPHDLVPLPPPGRVEVLVVALGAQDLSVFVGARAPSSSTAGALLIIPGSHGPLETRVHLRKPKVLGDERADAVGAVRLEEVLPPDAPQCPPRLRRGERDPGDVVLMPGIQHAIPVGPKSKSVRVGRRRW